MSLPRHITQVSYDSAGGWVEHTKRKCINELLYFCGNNELALDSDIAIEVEPSLFVEGHTRVTVRAWTK